MWGWATLAAATIACERFAGISRAQLCFVMPSATGAPQQLIEFTGYPEPTAELIMGGSRVRVPHFSTNQIDMGSGSDRLPGSLLRPYALSSTGNSRSTRS